MRHGLEHGGIPFIARNGFFRSSTLPSGTLNSLTSNVRLYFSVFPFTSVLLW